MKFRMINQDGTECTTYKSRYELLSDVRRSFPDNFREGVDHLIQTNSLLRQCCHHWGEYSAQYDFLFDCELEHDILRRRSYYKEFMIVDEDERTINLPDLAKASLRIKLRKEKEDHSYYRFSGQLHSDKWWEGSVFWTKHHERCKSSDWMRGKCLQQERKLSCDNMHKPFVRRRRNKEMLDPWGWAGSSTRAQITWKQMKIKHQYMERVLDK